MSRSSGILAPIAFTASLLLIGCSNGKKSFTLKGTVSYQGKPVPSGVVRLYLSEDRVARAIIQRDGSFEATDVLPGEVKVTVEEDPIEMSRRKMGGRLRSLPSLLSPSLPNTRT